MACETSLAGNMEILHGPRGWFTARRSCFTLARASGPLVRAGFGIAFRIGHRRILHGIPSSYGGRLAAANLAWERLDLALNVLHEHDRRQYHAVRTRLKAILIGGSTRTRRVYYMAPAQACVFTPAYFADTASPTWLAGTLVHEMTHARLHTMGFEYAGESIRRIERICTRQQLAFVQRVPGSELESTHLSNVMAAWRAPQRR